MPSLVEKLVAVGSRCETASGLEELREISNTHRFQNMMVGRVLNGICFRLIDGGCRVDCLAEAIDELFPGHEFGQIRSEVSLEILGIEVGEIAIHRIAIEVS